MTSRALRVGVLIGSQLVEERIFDGATPITFGQSLRCSLSLPIDGVPFEHVLFARDQDRWVLRITAAMEGRIGHGDQIAIVSERELPLAHGARGKLRIGDATLLFQELAARPRSPRPQLPASIRGTLADRIDRRLALIIGGSLIVHIAIAAWAWATDIETPSPLASQLEPSYRQETIDVTLPELPVSPPVQQPGIAAPVAPAIQTPHPIVRPIAPEHVDANRLANILAGDEGEHGVGGMHHRQPGSDLDKQLDEIRRTGNHVTIGDEAHTSRADDSVHISDARHDLGISDPTLTQTHHDELPNPGRIIPGTVHTDEPTTLTPDVILERIKALYLVGLERCYRKALVADPSLTGKIALSFTVDDRGHVADPEATGIDSSVDGCVSSQMAAWRFPTPKDKTGTPTDASYHITLALQPS